MNKALTVTILALTAAVAPVLHADTPQQIEATCQAYADEDGVPPGELQEYLQECIASLSAPEEPSPDEPAPDEPAPASPPQT